MERIQKSFVVEFNSQAQGSEIRLTDEIAANIYWRISRKRIHQEIHCKESLLLAPNFFSVENASSYVHILWCKQ